ncbi:MAG: hypothetical protein ACOCQS_02830 [Bacillota bacterium]
MENKLSLIISNLVGLIIFMIIHYALYHESFQFGQALIRGIGLMIIFNFFNWWFSGRRKK